MRLTREQAHARLTAHVHGVLCTLHPQRGPDPQPVIYAVSDDGHSTRGEFQTVPAERQVKDHQKTCKVGITGDTRGIVFEICGQRR